MRAAMAELEIDQSNLPRVRDVRQCFAVLEDGVLAHNLQEQEIEHYYTTNIQKNQLVQNDIRVAKRLQDEEEEQRAQQRATLRQTSRQIEQQDFEYARVIQEEIQRCAEEAQRRELDDQELAKHMQEEEEQRIRRRSRGLEGHAEGSSSDPLSPPHHHHTLSTLHEREEQYSPTTTRGQCFTSQSHSELTRPQTLSPRGSTAHRNTTSWSSQGHSDYVRSTESELRESTSENSDDSDTVFSERLSTCYQRVQERFRTAPHRQQTSPLQSPERNYRSLSPRSSHAGEFRGWEEVDNEYREGHYGSDYRQRRRPISPDLERRYREEFENEQSRRDEESRPVEARGRRCSRSESVRLHDCSRRSSRDLARTWSFKENPDRHVRFQEDGRSSCSQQSDSSSIRVWEMLGQILKERGVPVRLGGSGAPLQIGPQSRTSQVLHGSEVSYGESPPHQRAFRRAAATRHSFHGDIRERRRSSHRENSGRDHREERHNGGVYEISRGDAYLGNGSGKWKERRRHDGEDAGDREVRRTRGERRHWHRPVEERSSSEEEEEKEERREERPRRRVLQHSQSLHSHSSRGSNRVHNWAANRSSNRSRWRNEAAGPFLQPEATDASLHLGELHQVLEDEELARKLQEEEEETLLRRNSNPPPSRSYPEGDFRVAQVAQDEEIARFMQKQEIKSKRRSRELEGPASWREHRAMISHHERRTGRERRVPRERLDSEGLPSPTEDYSPENDPPSPVSTSPQGQSIRNIAEELDPTFQARRPDTENFPGGPTGPTSLPHTGTNSHDFEEPTFIPPTKRQTDKPGRSKPKEKKENCKQQ